MSAAPEELRTALLGALVVADDKTRGERADRILWLGEFEKGYSVMAHADTLALKAEARDAFVHGHFIATQVLAFAFFEHVLNEKLLARGLHKERMPVSVAIKVASENKVLPNALLSEADRLRELRNPFAHRQTREGSESKSHGSRVMTQKVHPRTLLEQDARDSMRLLYATFEAWLRDA